MNRWVLNAVLVLAFLGSLALHALVGWNPKQRNWEFAPDMARSPRLNAFAATERLPSGMVLQPPVAGTVAVDDRVLPFGPGPEEARRAGEPLSNPSPWDDRILETRGAKLFQAFCLPCHGAGGRGDGPVAQRGFPPPPPLSGERAMAMRDGQIFHVITFGQQNMPAYGGQIGEEDRWLLVQYVRKLQQASGR